MASVTVTTALPHAQAPIATPEPEEDFGCGVFAKSGASEDARAFRACLERVVSAEEREGGGSPDLATLELAVVLIDGTGGRVDIPRARALLVGGFHDVAVDAVIAHADAQEANPHTPPFESCDDFAQTTFASMECIAEHVQNERAWLRVLRRSIGPSVRPVFDAASRAAEAWEKKLGEIDYARYAGGTMRGPAMESRMFGAMKVRRLRLEHVHEWASAEALIEDRSTFALAKRSLLEDATPEVVTAFAAEETAWIAYRDAEATLYEALYPSARSKISVELSFEHTRQLCAMSSEP